MALHKREAERGLQLLWDFMTVQARTPQEQLAYEQAISSLHAYLSDILPASQPCVQARMSDGGTIEIRQDQDVAVLEVDLYLSEGEKLGIILDSVNVQSWSGGVSPIVITSVKPASAAHKDNQLRRGDQVLEINGHSLAQATLQRARWLLNSAERSLKVRLAVIPSGLMEGLKHSLSRMNLYNVQSTPRQKRSKSMESLGRITSSNTVHSQVEIHPPTVKRSRTDVKYNKPPAVRSKSSFRSSRSSSLRNHSIYAPSIGSRQNSNHSLVSDTVEVAAHIARSSMRLSGKPPFGHIKKRKVRKMHIMKGTSGLGLRIVGGKGSKFGDMGIFVRELEEGGAAFKDGRLCPGDELLMVDGKSLVGLSHDEAVAVLKTTLKLVQLVIATEQIEGESMASSLQSIPEKLANRVSLHGTPLRSVSHSSSRPQSELSDMMSGSAVAPEELQPPKNNTFFEESHELKSNMPFDVSHPSETVAETAFTSALTGTDEHHVTSPMEESEQFRIVQTVTPWARDSGTKRTPPPEPLIKNIIYVKEGKSLGFSVCGGKGSKKGDIGILVRKINPDGVAGHDGRLKEGDELLEVNGTSLNNCTHKEAADIIRNLHTDIVTLVVRSRDRRSSSLKRTPSVSGIEMKVNVEKLEWQPLGLQLAEMTRNTYQHAIFIKNIAPGSPAASCGELMCNDQLVAINKTSVLTMKANKARSLLSALPAGNIQLTIIRPHEPNRVETILENQQMVGNTSRAPVCVGSGEPVEQTDISDELVEDLFERSGALQDILSDTEVEDYSPTAPEPPSSIPPPPANDPPVITTNDQLTDNQPQIPPSETMDELVPLSAVPLPTEDTISSQGFAPPTGFIQKQFHLKKRARSGLGITVVASIGVTEGLFMIRRITSAGIAAKDGRLLPGDRLVTINGKDLVGLTHAAVLQTVTDAPKGCQLTIWRDPEYDGAAYLSGRWSGSRGSLASVEGTEERLSSYENSPVSIKRRFSHGNSPARSPLVAHSHVGHLTPTRNDSPLTVHRWSTGNATSSSTFVPTESPAKTPVLELKQFNVPPSTPPDLQELPDVPPSTPPDLPDVPPSTPPDLPDVPLSTPPDLQELPDVPLSTPPDLQELPDVPLSTPPDLQELPDVPLSTPPDLQELPTVPPSTPPELTDVPPSTPPDLQELPDVPLSTPPDLQELPSVPPSTPPELPDVPLSTPPDLQELPGVPPCTPPIPESQHIVTTARKVSISTSSDEDELPPNLPSSPPPPPPAQGEPVERPKSMGPVPKGQRLENAPFEIAITKGLFGLGVSLTLNEMGMVEVKSLTSRSPITKDGNIKVGDYLLSINKNSLVGKSVAESEALLKSLPRGQVKLVAMAPAKNVTGSGFKSEDNASTSVAKQSPKPSFPTITASAHSETASSSEDEGIVRVLLHRFRNVPLGISIEGGCDTPLQYVYITALSLGSPASNSGVLSKGDQLVMVGEECLIGKTHQEANLVLERAPESVELVAQRKTTTKNEDTTTDSDRGNAIVTIMPAAMAYTSSDDLRQSKEEVREENFIKAVPEETITVELARQPAEKLGLGLVGGSEHPSLKQVHVKKVVPGGVAHTDGHIKRGDRIVSVNGNSLAGVTNKYAQLLLKDAGLRVSIIIARKIGRRGTSAMPTPLGSTLQSRRSSGEQSKQESPKMARLQPRGDSSDEAPTPPTHNPSRRANTTHRRRASIGVGGEVLVFREKSRTLPRKLGSMVGVRLVELHKGPTGLGMQIRGGTESEPSISVKMVVSGGVAHKSGKVNTGDVILEVNKVSFENLTYDEALKTLKALPQGKVSLILRDRMATLRR